MFTLASALLVSASVMAAALLIARALQAIPADRSRSRVLDLLAMFAPSVSAADADPRAILVWQPLARTARQLFPEEFALIDAAAGGTFPFTKERLEAAHAHWTADWLSWERTHDSEYKLKAAVAEQELVAAGPSPVLRARLDAVEREKLELYQRRYAEYIRIAKALQALV
ncbi:MAG TPA: hypothetical protein VM818_10465 [Vicinamibacterales bacterium]|jgi:hypothetical protein|nr:hypothetical protein [Vicinamibacterales bacterium]